MPKPDTLADYLLDHYGHCKRGECLCREVKWLGRSCHYWVPMGAVDFKSLRLGQEALRDNND